MSYRKSVFFQKKICPFGETHLFNKIENIQAKISRGPLPIYFPTSRFDDSQESNQEKWRKLFLGSSHEDFHYNREFDRLIFKIVSLDENLPMRYSETKPSIIYRKALSPKVIHSSTDGLDIELEASLFFEWIGIPNPYLKTSLFKKLKRRINE